MQYEVTITGRREGQADVQETTTAGPVVAAAFLRAAADQIDPPKPTRPVMRGHTAHDG